MSINIDQLNEFRARLKAVVEKINKEKQEAHLLATDYILRTIPDKELLKMRSYRLWKFRQTLASLSSG